MTIAIPVQGRRLNQHFGQTEAFEIIEVDEPSRTVTAQRTVPVTGPGGCAGLPGLLKAEGVKHRALWRARPWRQSAP